MFAKLSFFAPLGALLAGFYSSLTCYSILRVIGEALREDRVISLPSGQFFGVIGLVLFGIGVTSTVLRKRTAGSLGFFIGAMFAFGISVLVIGYGNWQLRVTFQSLTVMETVDASAFILDVRRARLPLLFGWGIFVLGAALLFAAGASATPLSQARGQSLWRGFAITFALFATLVFLLTAVWKVTSMRTIENAFAAGQLEPAAIATGMNGMIIASFAELFGIACCAFASLMMSVAAVGSIDNERRHLAA